MIEDAAHKLLWESAERALETMFFTAPDEVSSDPRRPAGEPIAVSLTFQGAPPGRFGLVVSDPAARMLAGNFLACDDAEPLPPAEVAGVIAELANMMCGAVLSELESDANFDLGAPQPIHVERHEPGPDFTAGSPSICRLELSGGALVCFLAFAEPA